MFQAATQYYDMAFQPASTLAGRDVQVPLGTQSYAGECLGDNNCNAMTCSDLNCA